MLWWYRKGQLAFQMVMKPYWPMRLEGLDNLPRQGPVILAGNHPTVLDGGMLGVYTPRQVRFLIDARVLRLPLLGNFLRALGSIPVEKGSQSLQGAVQSLQQGRCIGIYPEAAPTGSMQLEAFKKGVAVLAQQCPEVPVVPVAIIGSQPLCSHYHSYAHSGPLALRYGKPLYYQSEESLEQFLLRLREELEKLCLDPLRHGHRKTPLTLGSACLFVPPSAILLALSRRRFEPTYRAD